MTDPDPLTDWRGATAIETLGPTFWEPVRPATFPRSRLRWRNDRAADRIGLAGLSDAAWLAHFARFEPLPDSLSRPLALAYHGHQFRSYNPRIGDGRGFLFAQGIARDGRLMDLGTKGSGRTPFSRTGDGRLTLKGGVRELLATEMLAALGVDTSATLSLVETGEALVRGDEPSPTRSCVFVRLNHGHVRIGTFQRLATLGDTAGLEALVRYTLDNLFGEPGGDAPALSLLERVVERTAWLAASYMVAGFVHGVLNSDNINVTGESFDYGPWRFAPEWDPGFTAAYFDETGLYAFGRQAEAILWDVAQLARSLAPLADLDDLAERLDRFAPTYRAALGRQTAWRLDLRPPDEAVAVALGERLERALAQSRMGLAEFWCDWRGGRPADRAAYPDAAFDALKALTGPLARGDTPGDRRPASLPIAEVEALWSAIDERDDWDPLHERIAAIRRMGAALAANGPSPAVRTARE